VPNLLDPKPRFQQMAEFIKTGQHDKANLETRQFNESYGRQLEETQRHSRLSFGSGPESLKRKT
jgi:hypothetical protein